MKIDHQYVIDNPEWIALFIQYKSDAESAWNDPIDPAGTRVFWRERKNKKGKLVYHGEPVEKIGFINIPKISHNV